MLADAKTKNGVQISSSVLTTHGLVEDESDSKFGNVNSNLKPHMVFYPVSVHITPENVFILLYEKVFFLILFSYLAYYSLHFL